MHSVYLVGVLLTGSHTGHMGQPEISSKSVISLAIVNRS